MRGLAISQYLVKCRPCDFEEDDVVWVKDEEYDVLFELGQSERGVYVGVAAEKVDVAVDELVVPVPFALP